MLICLRRFRTIRRREREQNSWQEQSLKSNRNADQENWGNREKLCHSFTPLFIVWKEPNTNSSPAGAIVSNVQPATSLAVVEEKADINDNSVAEKSEVKVPESTGEVFYMTTRKQVRAWFHQL